MKKTMFITSIVMVVVLAVALTTSSLAWFSAAGSTTVTVDQFTLTAQTRTSSAGLEMSNNGSVWNVDGISLVLSGTDNMAPMCPTGDIEDLTAVTATEFYNVINNMYTAEIENRYNAALNDNAGGYADYFMDDAVSATALSEVFYIRNSGDTLTGLTTTVAIDSTNNWDPVLWVAIFDITDVTFATANVPTSGVAPASVAQPKLVALTKKSGTSNNIAWCDDASDKMEADDPALGISAINPSNVAKTAAGDEKLEPKTYLNGVATDAKTHTFIIFAWFDGASLINANNGATMTIDISFAVAAPNNN